MKPSDPVIAHLKRALEQNKRHEFVLSRKSIQLALVAAERLTKRPAR